MAKEKRDSQNSRITCDARENNLLEPKTKTKKKKISPAMENTRRITRQALNVLVVVAAAFTTFVWCTSRLRRYIHTYTKDTRSFHYHARIVYAYTQAHTTHKGRKQATAHRQTCTTKTRRLHVNVVYREIR